MFIRLTIGALIGPRYYPPGSVVDVDPRVAEDLARQGHAAPDPGPASEPGPPAVREPEKAERRPRAEKRGK